jgi:hypothetical protein
MQTNQPKSSRREKEIIQPSKTFQDSLFSVTKVFWKAGYQYSQKGKNEDFYATLLEDFMNLSYQEFLTKYGE